MSLTFLITSDGKADEFDACQFLALMSCHIPKPYESIIRYYGWSSCRGRGEWAKRIPQPTKETVQEHRITPSVSWASCMKRAFEINPFQCPRCKGTMCMVAFLTNEKEILNIADALRIPRAQAPPNLPKALTQEFFDNLPPNDFA
ncbi:MAG: hypothetical protein QY326_05870 [Bdellovibrionota bacterium]|nr:MAG: hypothetical protein QY326_05870 [Bdellovibrionota bacterium]